MHSDDLERARSAWQQRGQHRPPFARTPGPGQESVWDYPRPPVIVDDTRRVQVKVGDILIADTRAAKRVLETASPPTFYLPPDSLQCDCLRPDSETSFCEWKGRANYFSVVTANQAIPHAAWSYANPFEAFAAIKNYLSFYPNRVACYVDGEQVRAQAGEFYGGWITDEIVGPFKGEAGTAAW
jgi:uncharacterized protein (DUF427 family)